MSRSIPHPPRTTSLPPPIVDDDDDPIAERVATHRRTTLPTPLRRPPRLPQRTPTIPPSGIRRPVENTERVMIAPVMLSDYITQRSSRAAQMRQSLVAPALDQPLTRGLGVMSVLFAAAVTGALDSFFASRDGLTSRQIAIAMAHGAVALASASLGLGLASEVALATGARLVPLRQLWWWLLGGPTTWFRRDPSLATRVALVLLGIVTTIAPTFPASRFVVSHMHAQGLMALAITLSVAATIPFTALVITLAAAPTRWITARIGPLGSPGFVISISALSISSALFWELNASRLGRLCWSEAAVFGAFPLAYVASLTALGVTRTRTRVAFPWSAPAGLAALALAATIASALTLDRSQTVASAVLSRTFAVSPVVHVLQGLVDADADGASPIFNGGDCDDHDPAVNPSAFDVPGNGVDENCTGADARPHAGEGDALFAVSTGLAAGVRPSFLLLTIDTLRPDHLGMYGYRRPTSPHLDAFAEGAVRFTRAYTTSPRTLRALSSVWTGRYPSRIAWSDDADHPALLESNTTLAEILSSHGYRTAAFTSTDYFVEHHGYTQGFTDQSHGDAFKADAARTADEAATWIRARSDDGAAFFAWVHMLEPHWPYRDLSEPRDFGHSPADLYDEEVARADELMGRVIAAADAWCARDPSRALVIIVTADHGEGLGAHGFQTHGNDMHEEAMRIPMIIRAPNAPPGVRRSLVSLVDLHATVLNYARLQPATALAGRSLIDVLRDPNAPEVGGAWRDHIFAELIPTWEQRQQPRALYAPPYKLLWDFHSGTWELYDLSRDSRESHNLFDERRDVASRMRERLNAWAIAAPRPPGGG